MSHSFMSHNASVLRHDNVSLMKSNRIAAAGMPSPSEAGSQPGSPAHSLRSGSGSKRSSIQDSEHSCGPAEIDRRGSHSSAGVRRSRTRGSHTGSAVAADSSRRTSHISATGRRSSGVHDLHTGSHTAAHLRTSGAPAASDSQQQLAAGSEPAATDEVSWALNDAAIPDAIVFQPLQHAQQQPDADALQQAGPTDPGDAAIAASASVDDTGNTAGEPAESLLMSPADPVRSDAGAAADNLQPAAEAEQNGAGDSCQLDGGAAAEPAEAGAAADMLHANVAEQREHAAASDDATEMRALAADDTALKSAEALDADNPAAIAAADDAEEQSGLLPYSPPEAASIPAEDQTVPDSCSTAAIELVMLPAAKYMQSTAAEAAATTVLAAACTVSEGSADAGLGAGDSDADELLTPDDSEAPAADAVATAADARDAQAMCQLPAEAVNGSHTSSAASGVLFSGAHAVAAAFGTASDCLLSSGIEGDAGQASGVTDPVPAIDEFWAAGQQSAEGHHGYGTSGSNSSSSIGDGGSVNDPVLASHDTSADSSIVDAAEPITEAEGFTTVPFEHTTAVADDEALPDKHGGEVASNMAQLTGVAAAAAVGAEPSADGEQGCAQTAPDYEAHSSASDAAMSEAASDGAADAAAASTVDDQDAEGTLEAPDMHVLNVESEPAEPQRRDAPAAYDTDSSWDDY
jgi:hypothetical protein